MIEPKIDDLLAAVDSKYSLVTLAAKRAREINSYYNQLGEGRAEFIPPLVETGLKNKPLSIALEEISEGKINAERPDLRFIFTPHSATADADTRARMAATMLGNLNSLVRSTSVRDIKELNLIPPLAFIKKEPRMLDDYRIFRWWQGK